MSTALMALLSEDDRRILTDRLRTFADGWRPGLLADSTRSLPMPGTPLRLPLLASLVLIDLRQQWAHAEPILVEDYLHAYPEVAASERALLELITAENEARKATGQPIAWEAFAKRFPHLTALIRQRLDATQGNDTEAKTRYPSTGDALPASGMRQTQSLPEQFGRYRIVKRLGRGGMGAVYLAVDTQLERQVALKVPLFDSGNTALLERFYREARLAATLHHPNLCPIHDVGEIGGIHFLTMPYIDGQPLSSWINPGASVPERMAVTLVRQAALAVHEAHQRGIIHRDLKPGNIMIDQRGEPIIMDFGLARRSSADEVRLTQSNTILGTPVYMSPEQASGGKTPVGPASDVYSLGVILYELLTGRVPFDGAITDVLLKIVMEPPPPMTHFRPGIDRRLEAICLKSMAKSVADRYGTMAEFAAELGGWLHQPAKTIPVAAPEPHPLARDDADKTAPLKKPSRRPKPSPFKGLSLSRWMVGGVLALGLACGCSGLAMWYGWSMVVSWMRRELPENAYSANREWVDVDRDWQAPSPGTSGEELLPPTASTGHGWTWTRKSLDTKASLKEYQLDRPGYHAAYTGFSDRIDVYVWKMSAEEKQTVFRTVTDHARRTDRPVTQHGRSDGSAVTLKGSQRSTTVWYQDEWLYLATGRDMADTEDVLLGVVKTVIANRTKTKRND